MSRYKRNRDYTSFGALIEQLENRGQDGYTLPLFRAGFAGDRSKIITHYTWDAVNDRAFFDGSILWDRVQGGSVAPEFTIGNDSSYDIYPAVGTPTLPTWGDPDVAGGLDIADDEWVLDVGYPYIGDYPNKLKVSTTWFSDGASPPPTSWFGAGSCRKSSPSTLIAGCAIFRQGGGSWSVAVVVSGAIVAGSARNAPAAGPIYGYILTESNRKQVNDLNSFAQVVGPSIGQDIPRIGQHGSETDFGYNGNDPVFDALWAQGENCGGLITKTELSFIGPDP